MAKSHSVTPQIGIINMFKKYYGEWRRWLAWYPVKTHIEKGDRYDVEYVWFKFVKRQYLGGHYVANNFTNWRYELINKDDIL